MTGGPLPVVACPESWPGTPADLTGKVVLVVGAAGGLGQVLSLQLARAGAEVVLAGRRVTALERVYDRIEALGGRAALYPLNLAGASPQDYAALADRVGEECGGLDGLVFASAHLRGLSNAGHTPPEDWLAALHVNLGVPFLLFQACLPLLRQRADGAAVFVVQQPERCARAYWGGYGVAQAGLAQLAAILADEFETGSPRIHAVDPGPMRTGLRQRVWFSEDPNQVPPPDRAAEVIAGLLDAGGQAWRGRLLSLS